MMKWIRWRTLKAKSVVDMFSLVAHDIQSPLAALNAIIKDIHTIPEQKRVLPVSMFS